MSTEFEGDLSTFVFDAELKEISRRRELVGIDSPPLEGPPTVELGLVGMSLSGGGIRSATFSLGVIQELVEDGQFARVDYLSTVSGGGFLGGCISSLLTDPSNSTDQDSFPLRRVLGETETPELTHLRNSSSYLNPGGLLNLFRLPNLLIRGIVLNMLIFLPYVMAAVVVAEVAYELGPAWDQLSKLVLPILLAFLAMIATFPFVERVLKRRLGWKRRNALELSLSVPVMVLLVLLVAFPILRVTRWAIEHSWSQFLDGLGSLENGEAWRWLWVFAGVVLALSFGGRASKHISRVSGKVVIGAVGLLGPGILLGIFLLLALIQIDSPFLPIRHCGVLQEYAESKDKLMPSATADRPVDSLLEAFRGRNIVIEGALVTAGTPPTAWYNNQNRPWYDRAQRVDTDACASGWEITNGSDAYSLERVSLASLEITGDHRGLFDGGRDLVFLAVALSLIVLNRYLLNVNLTAPHGFYRDRLSYAYIFRTDAGGLVESNDDLLLSKINGPGSKAPYHLINGTLNLQGAKNRSLRGRRGSTFLFSKCYIGSEYTGYAKTADVERHDGHLDLATAVAISGAAAAPNMGRTTVKPLVFVMSLLNIRLGYWLPNPAFMNGASSAKRIRLGGIPPSLVWKEAVGALNASGPHVNVSDGGHIENLGLYGLLQRRCALIIVVDGEADPTMSFKGLVAVMRFARIDMGIDIDVTLGGLRHNDEGLSLCSWVDGTIDYGGGETGKLVYIKLSVTGEEPAYVSSYRSHNAAFPHESTADQSFSEEQFEAYRALGEHIGRDVLNKSKYIGGSNDRSG